MLTQITELKHESNKNNQLKRVKKRHARCKQWNYEIETGEVKWRKLRKESERGSQSRKTMLSPLCDRTKNWEIMASERESFQFTLWGFGFFYFFCFGSFGSISGPEFPLQRKTWEVLEALSSLPNQQTIK